MARRRHRSKDTYTDNPYVTIDRERLRAAMEVRDRSVADLVRATGVDQQRISHHVNSRSAGRIRQEFRAHLARAMDVSEEFLAGDPVILPYAAYQPLARALYGSAKVSLKVSDFLTRVMKAALRDLERHKLGMGSPDKMNPGEQVVGFVLSALAHFMSPGTWRRRLVPGALAQPLLDPVPMETGRWHPKIDPNFEAAMLGACAWLEYALEPWLEGRADLNYAQLRSLVRYLNRAVDAWALDFEIGSVTDTHPLAALRPHGRARAKSGATRAPAHRRTTAGRRKKR